MFGLLYSLGVTVAATASGIKAASENAECISQGIKENNITNTYTDRKGVMRDLTTHKIVTLGRDYNEMCDDCYLWIGTPAKKIRNISEEKRRLQFEEGKRGNLFGRTVDLYDERRWATQIQNKDKTIIHGAFYVDLQNNNVYVCRKFSLVYDKNEDTYKLWNSKYGVPYSIDCKFYMDIKTGLLVRKSDTQLEYEKTHNKHILSEIETAIFIKQFNDAQKNGGWYHNELQLLGDPKILKKQDYYCDKFNCTDHIKKLIEIRG